MLLANEDDDKFNDDSNVLMMQAIHCMVSGVSDDAFIVDGGGGFKSMAAAESLDKKEFVRSEPKLEVKGRGKRLWTANRFYGSNFSQHYDEDDPEVDAEV